VADDVTLRFRLTGEDAGAGKVVGDAEEKVGKLGRTMKGLGVVGAAAGAAAGGLLAKSFSDNLDIGQAQAKLNAQLGLSTEDSAKAGKVASAVYAANWGDSMDTVDAALKSVATNMASISTSSEADLQGITSNALALAQTFDIDVNESTAAAGALMKNGLAKDATEAFDIITRGEQLGLDKAGDFLDTLTEYSPQFDKLGIGGSQALTILSAGLQAGARDTDVIADAFKEFSLRAIDGSKLTAGALAQLKKEAGPELAAAIGTGSSSLKTLGLDSAKTSADIAAGGDRARSATFNVLQALNSMKDPVKQNQAGVALFGTQWEDTLRQILPAVAGAEEGMEGVTGSTQRMADTVSGDAKSKIEGMQRSFQSWTQGLASAKGPLGDVAAGAVAFSGPGLAMAGSVGQVAAGMAAMNFGLVASKGAQLAGAAATGVATAAQWLWNAALSANPIGLIILAIVALVAALVWFFTKTELGRAIFQTAMQGIVTAFNWVKDTGGAVVTWVVTKWQEMTRFFSGLPASFGRIGSAIGNALLAPQRAAFNAIRSLWNSTVGGFSFSIPSWIPFVGGNSYSIPRMAKGGIVTSPTLLIAGEAGPEAIVPLGSSSAGAELGGGTVVEVHLHGVIAGDRETFSRTVVSALDEAVSRGLLPHRLMPVGAR
jgi:hypothetical protein